MKILLITYYFPPCGGAPVQRWLRLLPYICQKGHSVTVICSKGGDYPFWDPLLMERVPPSVRIIRVRAIGMTRIWRKLTGNNSELPYGSIPTKSSFVSRILIWIRLNLILPDLRIFWNPPAKRATNRLLSQNPQDLIITTGPPHSTHLIAKSIAKKFRIRWFADFRDPMSQIHYLKLHPPGKIAMNRLRKTEKEIVSQADLNLVVSQAISDALPDGHKLVILNGYEPRDFEGLKHNDSPFLRIKYVGQITAGQDIGLFAELFENLEREYRLYMIGTRLTQDEETKLRQACHDRLMIKSFVPHQEAVKEMVDSDILLLIINRLEGNQGILTTKLFEYLASRTPILCLGPPDTAAATIIRECEAGQNFDYHEIPEARKWLEQLPIQQRTTGNIELYSVESQSDILLSAMQSKIGVDK